ncbi:TadE/TadG family type IV pilus assembly protein [Frigidibacter sp. ROC022]|uniref:TadE/TadG family type IV pilus assembly protein n=1 Tax=Frigidibacter sp. ROC022 TaxID=2971796 RepID=UPI00215B3A29|nr:TadE family protein [Frigidibacter sp. ROC022]MCR8723675.1 pilus assembly protein [Frigidibacter sp. ROC022]
MIGLFFRTLRRFRREEGTATIEFVILFPVFIVLMISGIEAGVLMTRQMMLERGLDLTMRSLRLGTVANPTHDNVKALICKNSMIIPNCENVVQLELREVDTTAWNVPLEGNNCVDRTAEIDPVINFNPGERNKLMMVRACAVFDPMFPATGLAVHLPRDASGGYRLIATSAFVNEP